MNPKIEDLRRKALEATQTKEQEVAALRARAKEESKNKILGEMEGGNKRAIELALEEAGLGSRISQLYHEIDTAKRDIKRIPEQEIPKIEKDEAFNGQEELRQEAISLLRAQVEELTDLLPAKEGELQELKNKHLEVKIEFDKIIGTAKSYLGGKEFSQADMDRIWNYVESERENLRELNRYFNVGRQEGAHVFYQLAINEETKDKYLYEDEKLYLYGLPDKVFTNPKFYNEYTIGVQKGVDDILQEGIYNQKKLSDDQIKKIKNGKFKIEYKGQEVVIYDGVKPLEKKEVPENPFLTNLSEGEQKTILESTLNWERKDDLEKRLRLSDYREDVHEAILEDTKKEDKEFIVNKLKEKLPELEEEWSQANLELIKQNSEISRYEALEEDLSKAIRAMQVIFRSRQTLEQYKESISNSNLKKNQLKAELDALPKKFFGGKPKDEAKARQLKSEINYFDSTILNVQENAPAYTKSLEQAEQDLAAAEEKLKAVDPVIVEKLKIEKELWESPDRHMAMYYLRDKISKAIDARRKANFKIIKLKEVKEKWEAGKYLNVSLAEALDKDLK
jgi:hypothetical protein